MLIHLLGIGVAELLEGDGDGVATHGVTGSAGSWGTGHNREAKAPDDRDAAIDGSGILWETRGVLGHSVVNRRLGDGLEADSDGPSGVGSGATEHEARGRCGGGAKMHGQAVE